MRHLSKYDTTYNMSRRVSESLTPADILYMAERMVGEIAKRGGDNNNRPKFSKTEQSQFNRLLAKADKMIAEQGKLLAPNGKPSKLNRYQWAQVRTDNFKNWFGDWENDPENASQVIDPETKEPMVVYHGTNKDFTQFNKLSWVAYNPSLANDYAELKSFNRGGNSQVIATFVRAINPFNADLIKKIKPSEKYPYGLSVEAFIDSIENQSKLPRGTLDNLKSIIQKGRREEESGPTYSAHNFWNDAVSMFGFEGKNAIDQAIKEAGFDSIFYTEQEVLTVGLFDPTQIKSAIGNNGEFSPTNPDIRFSKAPKSDDAQFRRGEISSDSVSPQQENDNKKLNSLLHGWLGGKGEKTYEAVSSSVRGFLSRMPSSMALVNNAPPAFKQMMREMIRDSKQAELTVSDILKNSTSLKAEERTLLSDYLEKELALGITPPEDVVKVG
ncbi:MAG TPA: hypothetical protein PLJ88_10305, partial [Agitococcus sp.]|nr:hypothetical protein [Agitococcus sp.]